MEIVDREVKRWYSGSEMGAGVQSRPNNSYANGNKACQKCGMTNHLAAQCGASEAKVRAYKAKKKNKQQKWFSHRRPLLETWV